MSVSRAEGDGAAVATFHALGVAIVGVENSMAAQDLPPLYSVLRPDDARFWHEMLREAYFALNAERLRRRAEAL
jgi:hypothetical protein